MRIICFIDYAFGAPTVAELAREDQVTLVRRGRRGVGARAILWVKLRLYRWSAWARAHTLDPVSVAAYQAGVPIKWAASANAPEFVSWLRIQRPDLILAAGFGQILKAPVLEAAPWAVNVHPSLLPAYRGPTPPHWIIKNGEAEGGVTIHMLAPGIDSGDIVAQERITIPTGMREDEYEAEASRRAAALVRRFLSDLRRGTLTRSTQDESLASYFGFPPG